MTEEPKTEETKPESEKPEAPAEKDAKFSFLNERVKGGAVFRKPLVKKAAAAIGCGLLFGLAAALALEVVSPWIKSRVSGEDEPEITIPEDASAESSAGAFSGASDTADPAAEGTVTLTTENYAQLIASLNSVASDAARGMVTVTGLKDGEDKFNSMVVNPQEAAGLIVAQTASDVLILTPDTVLADTSAVMVTFQDNTSYDAVLRKRDANTGLAVFSVARASLSDSTASYYEVATLGNSYSAVEGTPILLLGHLFGAANAQAYGQLSSNDAEEHRPDGKFRLLTSDIAGTGSSGAFFNIHGEVIGFVVPEPQTEEQSVICAFPISDIKKLIENLSNGTSVPYVGIYGIDISASVAKAQGLKEGIYISEAALDSPAMAAGLQSGDIIQEFDGTPAKTLQVFRTALLNHAEGDTVEIKVQRPDRNGYKEVTCTVTIGALS